MLVVQKCDHTDSEHYLIFTVCKKNYDLGIRLYLKSFFGTQSVQEVNDEFLQKQIQNWTLGGPYP